jgi:hypothetical protein
MSRYRARFTTVRAISQRSETIEGRFVVGGLLYSSAMRDTSEPALERYYALLRARPPLARITAAAELSVAVRSLAESAIRAADPSASAVVVRARLANRLYGREVATRLFPGVPLDVG